MEFSFKIKTGIEPGVGKLLIAEPLLPDPHFHRSVIYLCSHKDDGSFGFVLNKPLDKSLDYFIESLDRDDIPVYLGGPVDNTSLYFMHTKGELLGGDMAGEGIYFDGDLKKAIQLLEENILQPSDILFFVGYAGWGKEQLEEEIEKKSWLVSEPNWTTLFTQKRESLWKDSILALDEEFHVLTSLPANPSLN